MHFGFLYGHILIPHLVDKCVLGQLARDSSGRLKQFQFWLAFNTLRWPTDLVSYGQVEATVWTFIFCNLFSNYK